jgi:hypothetical protein
MADGLRPDLPQRPAPQALIDGRSFISFGDHHPNVKIIGLINDFTNSYSD